MFRNSPWQVSAPALVTSWFLCFRGRFQTALPKNPAKINFTKLQIPEMLHQFGDFMKCWTSHSQNTSDWIGPLVCRQKIVCQFFAANHMKLTLISIHPPAASLTLKTTSPMPLGKICSKSLFNISPVEVLGSRGASTSSLWSMKSCGRTKYKVLLVRNLSFIMRHTYFNRTGFFKSDLLNWNTISRWTCQCTVPIEKA